MGEYNVLVQIKIYVAAQSVIQYVTALPTGTGQAKLIPKWKLQADSTLGCIFVYVLSNVLVVPSTTRGCISSFTKLLGSHILNRVSRLTVSSSL